MTDFQFFRGDTVEQVFTLTANRAPQSVAAVVSAALVATGNRGDQREWPLTVRVPQNDLVFALTASESAAIDPDTYRFQLRLTFPGGVVRTWRSAGKPMGTFVCAERLG